MKTVTTLRFYLKGETMPVAMLSLMGQLFAPGRAVSFNGEELYITEATLRQETNQVWLLSVECEEP